MGDTAEGEWKGVIRFWGRKDPQRLF